MPAFSLSSSFLSSLITLCGVCRFEQAEQQLSVADVQVRQHYSEELSAVLRSCVELDPVKRPSIQQLLDMPALAKHVRPPVHL